VQEIGEKIEWETILKDLIEIGEIRGRGTYEGINELENVKEHRFVNHSEEYAKDDVHVNTAENRHGFLRAWLRKFRGVSKHYQRNYISFFELLFNSKKNWFRIHHSVPDGLGG